MVEWSAATHRLRVIDQGEEGRASTAEALATAGAVAGVNGGYFHADRRPLGLVIAGGKPVHNFERARLLGGLVTVDAGGTMRRPATSEASFARCSARLTRKRCRARGPAPRATLQSFAAET